MDLLWRVRTEVDVAKRIAPQPTVPERPWGPERFTGDSGRDWDEQLDEEGDDDSVERIRCRAVFMPWFVLRYDEDRQLGAVSRTVLYQGWHVHSGTRLKNLWAAVYECHRRFRWVHEHRGDDTHTHTVVGRWTPTKGGGNDEQNLYEFLRYLLRDVDPLLALHLVGLAQTTHQPGSPGTDPEAPHGVDTAYRCCSEDVDAAPIPTILKGVFEQQLRLHEEPVAVRRQSRRWLTLLQHRLGNPIRPLPVERGCLWPFHRPVAPERTEHGLSHQNHGEAIAITSRS